MTAGCSVIDFNTGVPDPVADRSHQRGSRFSRTKQGKNVPVLHLAKAPEAAICESLLPEVPATGGAIYHADYSTAGLGRFRNSTKLNLAQFMGIGLRRLSLDHRQLTSTDASCNGSTVQWAREAHSAGFDAVIWMSHRCNTDPAVGLFGGRVMENELTVDTGYAKILMNPTDEDWLSEMCTPLHIDLIHP